ncbi:hypothetical protein E2986_11671 [Frieseomelitta varia]|uniref:Uncharacterized protein n=1 Tax=Frieseomelitta varia TaxID=561572 RepID=A0A833RWA5_9HYME|nr:hypothetical protein E2986_11671 [Frieseomelitta varia]
MLWSRYGQFKRELGVSAIDDKRKCNVFDETNQTIVVSSFCWPLSTSSRTRILVYAVLRIISVINACMLFLALLYSVYVHSDDIIIVFESVCLGLGVSQLMIQTIICSVNYKSLQIVRKTSFEKSELNTVKIEDLRLKI